MARAATAGELASLRTNGQWSKLYLAIQKPSTMLACRVNQSFTSTDLVDEITYDTVTTGAYTNVSEGMTMYVGSALGKWDLGLVRVLSATVDTIRINSTSDIPWANDLFLTVVDEFALWPRNIVSLGDNLLMDGNTGYADQHANPDPVGVFGPLASVYWLTGATVAHQPSAASSWTVGAAIDNYVWFAPNAAGLTGDGTATPTITYNAARGANAYWVGCALYAGAKSSIGYRRVFVFNDTYPPIDQFRVSSLSGEWGGGWQISVELYDQAAIDDVRDRALVILFARDFYGITQGSVGPVTGHENVIFCGWIDGESIDINSERTIATFTVSGPAAWLDKISVDSMMLNNVETTPADWDEFQDLTVDKAYYHLIRWRSTASTVMDCYATGDTHEMPGDNQLSGSLFSQIERIGSRICATPSVDRYGRMYLEIDTQMLPTASRASIPTVMEITESDYAEMDIQRDPIPRASMVEVTGVIGDLEYRGRSPGSIPSRAGQMRSYDGILVASQAETNLLAGMAWAYENNEYPIVDISLGQDNRMIDICPRQYVTLSLAAGDTIRGHVWTNKKFIPRRVELAINNENGSVLTNLELEAETVGVAGMAVAIPQVPTNNDPNDNDLPDLPDPIDSPELPYPPIVAPVTPVLDSCKDDPSPDRNGPFQLYPNPQMIQSDGTASVYLPFPCAIRRGDIAELLKTFIGMNMPLQYKSDGTWIGVANSEVSPISVTAVGPSGGDLISAVVAPVTGGKIAVFSPGAGLDVSGFKISLTATSGYVVGTLIDQEAIQVDDADGYSFTITPGNAYALRYNSGEYFHEALGPYSQYEMSINGTDWYEPQAAPFVDYYTAPGNGDAFFTASTASIQVRCSRAGAGAGETWTGSITVSLHNGDSAVVWRAFLLRLDLYNICAGA